MAAVSVPDKFKVPNAFWAWLRKIGLTPATVLRQSKLPTVLYDGEKNVVTTAQFFALWRAVAELRPEPDIGLRLARELDVAHLPPSSLAPYYALDYRDALGRLARFKLLCSAEEMSVREAKGECVVHLAWIYSKEPPPALLIDAAFASIVELGRYGTQVALKPARVDLARPRETKGVHEAFFCCKVNFRAARDLLVLRADDLDRPFITHNSELLDMLKPSLVEALSDRRKEGSVRERVKWTLKRLLAGNRPDIIAVARELGMSSRTLQRRITEEGGTFQHLLVEARQELARHYLAEASIEIGELAYLVGYDDPNSFYRAFRSWEGVTPAEWRSTRRPSRRKR